MRLLIILFICSASFAQDTLPKISNYWLQAAPPNASVMAAYVELTNTTGGEMILVDAYSPAFEIAMIHQSKVIDGIAKMVYQDKILIKLNEKLIFKPGSYHIMLMQPLFKINKGDLIKVNLIYKNTEDKIIQEIWFPVEFR